MDRARFAVLFSPFSPETIDSGRFMAFSAEFGDSIENHFLGGKVSTRCAVVGFR
jgi:hypothetical protein